MNTREAIEFIKKHNKKEFFYTWERENFKEIIELLKRGEKYEQEWEKIVDLAAKTWQMWEELYDYSIFWE